MFSVDMNVRGTLFNLVHLALFAVHICMPTLLYASTKRLPLLRHSIYVTLVYYIDNIIVR